MPLPGYGAPGAGPGYGAPPAYGPPSAVPPPKPPREPNPRKGKIAWLVGLVLGAIALAAGAFALVFYVILG
ncbi:MAG: hypothetical protein LBS27_05350 [Bifidobacteriaceae bacterium]|jgi:hypothetical protein|nr:hypothetical protein [Bifidobacteriaceae bacterium]